MFISESAPSHLSPQVDMLLFLSFLGFNTIEPASVPEPPATPVEFSHDLLEKVQSTYVDEFGRVDYARLARDPGNLDRYYQLVAAFSPDSHPDLFPGERDRLTYWINAYNGAVLRTVLEYYPIVTVGDVTPPRLLFFMPEHSGFFYFQKLRFGGESLNLYDLEHEVIRKRFDEPRVHFAINCASNGCPRLPQHAFTAANLEAELERETLRFAAEERNVRVHHDDRAVYVSSIFSWYETDFVDWYRAEHKADTATLLDYIRLYSTPEITQTLGAAADYEVRSIPYDWGLNDQALLE
jgi:hypothetical protein